MNNAHLTRAKRTKDDEFYTSYDNAKKMATPFARHFKGKCVLCNCDAPNKSELFDFMRDNFEEFGIKKLVGVGYNSYMQVVTKDGIDDIEVKNNGDFKRGESLDALKDCDVVFSNPPFSSHMFIDFIKLTLDNGKDVLAIGPLDGAKAKDVKPYIMSGKLHVVKSPYEHFLRPIDSKSKANKVKVAIYTTFDEDPFSDELELSEDTDILDLPQDGRYLVPVSIASNGKFSIREIPD